MKGESRWENCGEGRTKWSLRGYVICESCRRQADPAGPDPVMAGAVPGGRKSRVLDVTETWAEARWWLNQL